MIVLLIVWLMFTIFLMSKNEKVLHYRQLAIPKEIDVKSELNDCQLELHFILLSFSFHSQRSSN